jgi:hypothetical protein
MPSRQLSHTPTTPHDHMAVSLTTRPLPSHASSVQAFSGDLSPAVDLGQVNPNAPEDSFLARLQAVRHKAPSPCLMSQLLWTDGCLVRLYHTHTHTHKHTRTHAHAHTHAHTLTHTRTHTHKHTRTHTCSPMPARSSSALRCNCPLLSAPIPCTNQVNAERVRALAEVQTLRNALDDAVDTDNLAVGEWSTVTIAPSHGTSL